MTDSPHLILPVETAARELDAKLLLALMAANAGMSVTLGNKALLNLRISGLRPGIYLSHNFNAGRDRIISLARRLGHRLAAWDEEGLVWINEDIYRKRRANLGAMKRLDLLLLWGEEQNAALAPLTASLDARVVASGNPRADLLRKEMRPLYEARVSELRKELGDFILINSNFGWINHALARSGSDTLEEHLKATALKSGFPLAYLAHRHKIYRAFTATIPKLARQFPKRQIVVRPHPSESRNGWRSEVSGLENVSVRYDSDLVPWLLAAGHIVQNGCTTAVETAMLGRAAISYRPFIVEQHEIPQPHRVSHVAHDDEELLSLLSDAGSADSVPPAFASALEQMAAGLDGPFASTRIVDELLKLSATTPKTSAASRALAKGGALLRRAEKSVLRHVPGNASQSHYVSQKFPPIAAATISARLAEMAALLSVPAPRVHALADRIFRIEAARS